MANCDHRRRPGKACDMWSSAVDCLFDVYVCVSLVYTATSKTHENVLFTGSRTHYKVAR